MANRIISLKVDVDTYQGMQKGVPVLLDILGKHGIKATFFLSFGPDNSGKAIYNIFRQKGFLSKMLRTGAPRLYGFKTMLYGTLLPAPFIASSFPLIIEAITKEGNEIGVHAWNHRLWQDHLDELSPEEIRKEFDDSFTAYKKYLSKAPKSTAAPAWYCNRKSLEIQDSLGLDYCSDTRGNTPFYPRIDGKELKTLQIPSNQPCIEEIIGLDGITETDIVNYQITHLKEDIPNIMPIHAEVEGGVYQKYFDEFITKTLTLGFSYKTMNLISEDAKCNKIPTNEITYDHIPGRSSLVSMPAV